MSMAGSIPSSKKWNRSPSIRPPTTCHDWTTTPVGTGTTTIVTPEHCRSRLLPRFVRRYVRAGAVLFHVSPFRVGHGSSTFLRGDADVFRTNPSFEPCVVTIPELLVRDILIVKTDSSNARPLKSGQLTQGVGFPRQDGPTIAKNSPSRMVTERSDRTSLAPNRLPSSSSRTSAMGLQ